MHQVRSCDFCGEEAVGVFESMPPELEPTEAEQRRFALCASCRDRLQAVVEPYVERLEAVEDRDQWPSHEAGSASEDAESGSDRESRDRRESRQPDRRRREQSTGIENAERAREGDTAADQHVDSTSPRDADVTVAEYVEERKQHHERTATPDATESDADGGGADADTGDADDADDADDSDDSGTTDRDGIPDGQSSARSPARRGHPKGYRKVVRLLSNRDGAMSRSDLRSLATNAYALDEGEFETAVDAALQTGDLEEVDDGLRAP